LFAASAIYVLSVVIIRLIWGAAGAVAAAGVAAVCAAPAGARADTDVAASATLPACSRWRRVNTLGSPRFTVRSLKEFQSPDFTISRTTCTGETLLKDLTFRGAPEGEKMGRAQQSVVFIVVVLSIALYLALRQFGPAPIIGVPPSATVPIPH